MQFPFTPPYVIKIKIGLAGLIMLVLFHPAFASLSLEQKQFHVLNRLGYGPNAAELTKIRKLGIQAYIDQQLNSKTQSLSPALIQQLEHQAVIPSLTTIAAQEFSLQQRSKAAKASNAQEEIRSIDSQRRERFKQLDTATKTQRILLATYSPNQLEEVMVDFWYNHFNVYAAKSTTTRLSYSDYEKNAIRPYALGHFSDLLNATAHHPAMLDYLDNRLSAVERTSTKNNKKTIKGGINENYARELMELHTLGVNGGYSQADVTALARILTGWTYNFKDLAAGKTFSYNPQLHDSTQKKWLGQSIASGQQQEEGEKALQILANSPATAKHIAYELASYFVADQPPQSLVNTLANAFIKTHGDIRQVLHILFNSREFWDERYFNQKFKPPFRYVISSLRATNIKMIDPIVVNQKVTAMGMPLYGAFSPDGYDWKEATWLSPTALKTRIDYATQLGRGNLFKQSKNPDASINYKIDPDQVFIQLAPLIAAPTSQRYEQLTDPALKITLLMGSPDFMRY